MESLNVSHTKAKRVRLNPQKRWTPAEEKALVSYLLTNLDVERPTAKVYYKRFLEANKLEIEWHLLRSKVRNMRNLYNKAKAWKSSQGVRSMNSEFMKATLTKMFAHFYEFEKIFGGKLIDDDAFIEDTLDCSFTDESTKSVFKEDPERSSKISNFTQYWDELPSGMSNDELPSGLSNDNTVDDNLPSNSRSEREISYRTDLSEILEAQDSMMALKKQVKHKNKEMEENAEIRLDELDLKAAFKQRELAIKEEEIQLKREELQMKERLSMAELKMKERLAMEELKMKERLAIEELRLKYKNDNK